MAPLEAPTLLAEALRPPVGAEGSEAYRVALDSRATQRLAEFARQQKVTLNTLLQAAWSLLLQRYTGQDCVVFGATVAGRSAPLPGIEEQLGLFINTLPLVCAMKPDQTVSQWLGELQGLNLAMREFEHVPLYDIQGWAGQQGAALFDSLLVFENFPVAEALKQGAPAGLSFANLHNHERTHYPLTLGIELGEGLSLDFSYDAARFSAAQVAQLSANLQHLLAQLVALPDAALGALELLDADGKEAVIAISQPAAVELSTTRLVHEQIAAQAAATPDALALRVDGQGLSYGQLNTQANRLAHRLIENGAGPGKRVGLALHRGPQLIVSLLAVLKSGAAYVPLDPKYPVERLAYMIDDSRLDLLLCESGLLEDVPGGVLRLSLEDNAGYPDSDPQNHAVAEDLAYIIYTSGSTGQPKGVAIAHGALREFCQTAADYSRLSASDRVLQFATFSFDGFVEQCFPALCVGAALIMRGDDLWDAGRLAAEIVRQGVTVADLPAAYWYLLARECASGVVSSLGDLRQVHVGGEAMSVEGLRLWHQAGLSPVRLLNTYGPTEATVVSSVHECRLEDASDAFGIPIGRAIAGRALYVLDAAGQLLPNGGVGELCIGAPASLAQSYFDRPALTAERFLPDPFAREPGARLYRSGDLARYNADGNLEYVGRIDHQVKIRGFRIEMGEIEACLQAREEVREAAVIAQDGTQLVAYIVASGAVASQAEYLEELKAVLRQSLPEYMVPSHLILLARLPLNNNGKLDRKALPRVEAGDAQRDFVAPAEGLGNATGADLARGVAGRAGGPRRQFLRVGRSLAPGAAGDLPRTSAVAAGTVREQPVLCRESGGVCRACCTGEHQRPTGPATCGGRSATDPVLRPTTPMDSLAAGSTESGLQHSGRTAPQGHAEPRGPARSVRPVAVPSPNPAHHLRAGRSAGTSRASRKPVAATGGTPLRSVVDRQRRGRRNRPAVRPAQWPAVARIAAASQCQRACAGADRAPHRRRWLVDAGHGR